MIRRLVIGALAAAGLWLVAVGTQKWFIHREVSAVVQVFMQAMQQGDHATLMSLLEPNQRTIMEAQQLANGTSTWQPMEGLEYRIHHIEIEGKRATAKLLVEKDGFRIRPIIQMRRSPTSLWKISEIEDLDVDPAWYDLQEDRAKAMDEILAKELAAALEGHPGVEVERVSTDDLQK